MNIFKPGHDVLKIENEGNGEDPYRKEYDLMLERHKGKPDYAIPYMSLKRQLLGRIAGIFLFFAPVVILAIVLYGVLCIGIVPTESMEPSVLKGDIVIADRLSYKAGLPERGDVVIFKHDGSFLIKRIIGLPGEHVELSGGRVYIDGAVLEEETYLGNGAFTLPASDGNGMADFDIPEDGYFVLGDNREKSADSRYWEDSCYVESKSIYGRVFARIRPGTSGVFCGVERMKYTEETEEADLIETVEVPETDIEDKTGSTDAENVIVETLPAGY